MLLKPKFVNYLALFAILFGITIRFSQYLSNRSLWGDEASIALNIVDRSYLELLQPLDYNQAAPPGFLWIEKLAVQLFGNNEYALRFFPLIAGIISLFALYELAKKTVSVIAIPIALILLASLKEPLYYATEVKQYSSDIMVALLISLLLIPLQNKTLETSKIILISSLGIVAFWLSHPAIFVLAGIEIVSFILTPALRKKEILINRLPLYLIWIIGFIFLYFITLTNVAKNQNLHNAWKPEYPQSIFDFIWLIHSFIRFFNQPLGFKIMDEVAIVVFIIGTIIFLRKKKQTFLILMSPLLVTLVAAYLHKYPFRSRLILFLTPFFILIIAEGTAFFFSHFTKPKKRIKIAGLIIATLLIFPPLIQSSVYFFHPETRHEIRPIIEYIKTNQKPDDAIFLAGGSPDQFQYYAAKYGYSNSMYYILPYDDFFNPETFSEQTWEEIKRTTPQLQNKQRVWFVVSGLKRAREVIVKSSLDRIGQKLDYFSKPGSLTYLYQLK
ncbi:glycosyltransferase family 39 protein [Floridanema evergladense]|uniref:Glycosyltransferase family 39 protein n=1 Tax=Floridaenema evergladense BLCC-F167 TaxID=3153639 RepID=A0ABV4WSY5_9CYAN